MRDQVLQGAWVLANTLAILLGGSVVGFFIVGPIVFADGPLTERNRRHRKTRRHKRPLAREG